MLAAFDANALQNKELFNSGYLLYEVLVSVPFNLQTSWTSNKRRCFKFVLNSFSAASLLVFSRALLLSTSERLKPLRLLYPRQGTYY